MIVSDKHKTKITLGSLIAIATLLISAGVMLFPDGIDAEAKQGGLRNNVDDIRYDLDILESRIDDKITDLKNDIIEKDIDIKEDLDEIKDDIKTIDQNIITVLTLLNQK